MTMNTMVFDIETVPDTNAGARIYDLHDLSDSEIAEVMYKKRFDQTGSDFLPVHLHKIVAISVVLRRTVNNKDSLRVWSLGDIDADEHEIVSRFFDGINRLEPKLVSWNGGGFDLPVLQYRALFNGVNCAQYFEDGTNDPSYKWNNYTARFHSRHTDLMEVLGNYTARCPLTEVAQIVGAPGKLGMDGSKVWQAHLDGDIKGIRDYCETDVLNTWLVYLRFALIKGTLDTEGYAKELMLLRDMLIESENETHLAFLEAWSELNPWLTET